MAIFDEVHTDRYRYRIEDQPFDVGTYLDFRDSVWDEAEQQRRRREEAAAATPVP